MNNALFLQALSNLGWKVEPVEYNFDWEALAEGRLKNTADEFRCFVSNFQVCTNQDDDIWLLSSADYAAQSDSAFAWNEFELQSKE